METSQRIFGLDLIRVFAIVMVLMAQSIWILPQFGSPIVTQVASLFHFIGLEIFFVLSGFLLGNSVYQLLMKDGFGVYSILHFLKKRTIQVLPLYYFVLLINFLIASFIGYPIEQGWKYILLIQNFASPMPDFFAESWGLPIIVFGALLFPSGLVAFYTIFKPKNKSKLFFLVTVLFIALFLISKCSYNATNTHSSINQWYSGLKPIVIYRLDAVFIGVLWSWMLNNIPFVRRGSLLFAVGGAIGIGFIFVGVGHFHLFIENHPFFWNVIYLPLTSMSIAFFLPLFYKWRSNFTSRPIQMLSSITYAVYLVHLGIVLQVIKFYFPIIQNRMGGLLMVIVYLTITFFFGFLLYRYFQKLVINHLSDKS